MKPDMVSDAIQGIFPVWTDLTPVWEPADSFKWNFGTGAEQNPLGVSPENFTFFGFSGWQTAAPTPPELWQAFFPPTPPSPIDFDEDDPFVDHFDFEIDSSVGQPPIPSIDDDPAVYAPYTSPSTTMTGDAQTDVVEGSRQEDAEPDPALPTVGLGDPQEEPTNNGRPPGATPGDPVISPPSPPPGTDNATYGRPPDAGPDLPPETELLVSYTSGGAPATSYNVTIEFVGTWTVELQAAFIDSAEYLGSLILADIPDVIVNSVLVDDISITATLDEIDGVGGILGSAGPNTIRLDGTFLPPTAEMTFDVADAQNMLTNGLWETVVLHEMLHSIGFGTLWSLMGLTSGSISLGNLRFIGVNATDIYNVEFPEIAGPDGGSIFGVPVETDGGPGTAGGHWDEVLFDTEIMTGFVDPDGFVSLMTIAALEDMGYDTVFDNPYSATDLSGPIPVDPLLDLIA